jgi:hypothetical protein
MSEPHLVGINEAARLTGKNKATISRDTKSGKLSSTQDNNGAKRYQVGELERVYGTLRNPDTGYAPGANHQSEPPEKTSDTTLLPEVLKAKDDVIELLKSQVDDLRRDRDNWREQANQALRALPAPAETTPAPVTEPPKKRGFWPLGRKATA